MRRHRHGDSGTEPTRNPAGPPPAAASGHPGTCSAQATQTCSLPTVLICHCEILSAPQPGPGILVTLARAQILTPAAAPAAGGTGRGRGGVILMLLMHACALSPQHMPKWLVQQSAPFLLRFRFLLFSSVFFCFPRVAMNHCQHVMWSWSSNPADDAPVQSHRLLMHACALSPQHMPKWLVQ